MILKSIRNNKISFFVWFLTGIIFSFSICTIKLSDTVSLTTLYNVGKVYDIHESVYRNPCRQADGYVEKSGKVVLSNGMFSYDIMIEGEKKQWNYFCVELNDADVTVWTIYFAKEKNSKIIGSESIRLPLSSGMNLVSIPKCSFNRIMVYVTGENDSAFCVKNMQLRENPPVFSMRKVLKIVVVSWLIYCLLSIVVFFVWKKIGFLIKAYDWIKLLQDIYILIVKQLKKDIEKSFLLKKHKDGFITFLFVLMFIYNVWVEIFQSYYAKIKYHILFYSIIIVIIAILSTETQVMRRKWNNSLVWSWLVLWIMACISDFLIPKELGYVGYAMLFSVGFFIFIWNNMKRPETLTKNFVHAVHIFFGFITLFCLICRPENVGGEIRYAGISRNPSIFALYLGTIYSVILAEIENLIKNRERFNKIIFYIIEGCIALSFCWKSQSVCPLLCMIGISFIWLVRMNAYTRKHKYRKRLVSIVISVIILIMPTYLCIDWGINHIPQFFGVSVTFIGEEPIAKQQYGMVAYASDLKEKFDNSRIRQKFSNTTFSEMISGRDYYYRTYLRDMNLFGHSNNPKMWGKRRLPHNAVLGIAHRYGVFAVVPYILMLVMVIIRTFRYANKNISYAAVPFYVCLSAIMMSMVDNVEQPFVWLPWIGLYLMMGIVFDNETI